MDEGRGLKKEIYIVLLLFVIGVAVRFYFSDFVKYLVVYPDEYRYYGIARSLYDGMGLSLRNATTDYQKILYSIVISPFFAVRDGILRNTLICFFNCLIMVSSIFPIYLICKKIDMRWHDICLSLVLLLIWQDMVFTMTFMSEILYWPLALWFIYLWMVNNKVKSYGLAILEGVLCYLGYNCKEIFLAFLMANCCYEIICPILDTILDKNRIRWSVSSIAKLYDKSRLIRLGIIVGVFAMCHIIAKLTIFAGLGNSYNQMGLYAIMSVYKFLFMLRGFFFYIAGIMIAVLILPIIYPAIHINKLEKKTRELFIYALLFLLISAFVIAYTITVREDLGRVSPRLHLRYTGPATFLMIVIFIRTLRLKMVYDEIRKYKGYLACAFISVVCYVIIFFKGINTGSLVDQYGLLWFKALQSQLLELTDGDGEWVVYKASFILVCAIVICLSIAMLMYSKSKIRLLKRTYIMVLIVICTVNNAIGIIITKRAYSASSNEVKQLQQIESYIESEQGEGVLIVTKNSGTNNFGRYIDTYYEDVSNIYMANIDSINLDSSSENLIKDIVAEGEPIFKRKYGDVERVEYVILDATVSLNGLTIANGEKMEEVSDDLFTVYALTSGDRLVMDYDEKTTYKGNAMTIYFTGDDYNAMNYVRSGISDKEDGFSWTNGDALEIAIPSALEEGMVEVSIDVVGTFDGVQRYNIRGTETTGQIDGAGQITFYAGVNDGKISFALECPDAKQINEVDRLSSDSRKVAFMIRKINILPVK